MHRQNIGQRSVRSVLNALVEGGRAPLQLGRAADRPDRVHEVDRVDGVDGIERAERLEMVDPEARVIQPAARTQQNAPVVQPVQPQPPTLATDCPSIHAAIDVHVFDHDWKVPDDLPRYTEPARNTLFRWILEKMPNEPGVRMVINDANRAPNYDPRSGAMACDLLAALLARAYAMPQEDQDALLKEIALQMHDSWTTGRCQQGRTTRLYQLWMSFA